MPLYRTTGYSKLPEASTAFYDFPHTEAWHIIHIFFYYYNTGEGSQIGLVGDVPPAARDPYPCSELFRGNFSKKRYPCLGIFVELKHGAIPGNRCYGSLKGLGILDLKFKDFSLQAEINARIETFCFLKFWRFHVPRWFPKKLYSKIPKSYNIIRKRRLHLHTYKQLIEDAPFPKGSSRLQ